MGNKLGKLIGAALLAAATLAIWCWPKSSAPKASEPPVRPVKSILVSDELRMPDVCFAGKVVANSERSLVFKQAGRVKSIPIYKSQRLKKGDMVACLDPKDFEDQLAIAKADYERDKVAYQRRSEAALANAVSEDEVSQALAKLKVSESSVNMAQRALEETVLTAPFDCEVIDVPGTELDMVKESDVIAVIQASDVVKIDVAIPESYVITEKMISYVDLATNNFATFDSFPERRFPVKFSEYVTAADLQTQTYTATYVMPAVEDLLILPGMSATVTLAGQGYYFTDLGTKKPLSVPSCAVGVDAQGDYFVWVLKPLGEGVYETEKRPVELARRIGEQAVVTAGLASGERVATAGVTVLGEGRKVTLFEGERP